MEPRKQAIIDALRKFMNQRSGIEFGNYGDVRAFRAEQRSITKALHQARELMRAVELSSITADDLIRASEGAFSGRLTLKDIRATYDDGSIYHAFSVDYVTGQYFPTEYRKAVCAVLASALWNYTREKALPEVSGYTASPWGFKGTPPRFATRADAEAFRDAKGGACWGHVGELHAGMSAGAWLRQYFRKEFGRDVAARWFS